MAQRLVCAQGHQWEASGESHASNECPQCGGFGETIVEGKSLSTDRGPLDELPPLPEFVSSELPEPVPYENDQNRDASPTPGPRDGPGSFSLPESFGRYRIVKRLGYGGMGAVYLAHDNQLERCVALKVPHFVDDKHPRLLERFQREARAAAALDHPHICSVYDVGQIDGVNYIAMAYIEGEPLSKLIPIHEQLPERGVADLIRRLALALAEAHAEGVVHRDLKPANIMINKRHEPVIMDFGLARREQSDDVRLTGKGAVLGTPAYMAPEQVGGDPKQIGPACDIYSLGVIMYELLTGRLPFDGSVGEILAAVAVLPPPPLSQIRSNIDPQLESICLQALAKTPDQRIASMNDFAGALGDYLGVDANITPQPLNRDFAKADSAEGKKRKSESQSDPNSDSQAEQASEKEGLATQLLAELAARIESGALTPVASATSSEADGRGGWRPTAVAATILILIALVIIFLINRPGPVQQVTIRFEISTVVLNDPTVVVLLDNRELSRDQLGMPLQVDEGQHQLIVKRGNEILEFRTIDVGSDDSQRAIPLLADKQSVPQKSIAQSNTNTTGTPTAPGEIDPTLTVKVDQYYASENSLHSSLSINDRLVSEFESATRQIVAEQFRPGWNQITLKTSPEEPASNNKLEFSVGPLSPDEGEGKFAPLLWSFANADGWTLKDEKYTHRLGPEINEVTLVFHLYYAGLNRENLEPAEGDFVLSGVPKYDANTPTTATVYINGTPLNSFAGEQRQVVITDLLKQGRNEIRLKSKRVDNSMEDNENWLSITRMSTSHTLKGDSEHKPLARFNAMTGWIRHKQTGQLINLAQPDSNTVDRTIPLFLPDHPKNAPSVSSEPEMMVVATGKYSDEQYLVSELLLNDQLIGMFTADTYESIEENLKPGWNTVRLRTFANYPEATSNYLDFQWTRRMRDPAGNLIDQVLWRFQNREAWSGRDGKLFNLLGPDESEVTVSLRLYYAGQEYDGQSISNEDYVLVGKPKHDAYTTSVTSTVFVNGQPLSSFAGNSRQVAITPLLQQGKNEIRLVTCAVKNCLDENDIHFSVQGPAKFNIAKQDYDRPSLLEFNSLKGWTRDQQTGQLANATDSNQETVEHTLEFTISDLPENN